MGEEGKIACEINQWLGWFQDCPWIAPDEGERTK